MSLEQLADTLKSHFIETIHFSVTSGLMHTIRMRFDEWYKPTGFDPDIIQTVRAIDHTKRQNVQYFDPIAYAIKYNAFSSDQLQRLDTKYTQMYNYQWKKNRDKIIQYNLNGNIHTTHHYCTEILKKPITQCTQAIEIVKQSVQQDVKTGNFVIPKPKSFAETYKEARGFYFQHI